MATKMSDEETRPVAQGFNCELCAMDEINSKSSFIFWPPIPHVPHKV